MSKLTRMVVEVAVLSCAVVTPAIGAQAGTPSACNLLTASDIKKITGRSDLATAKPDLEESSGHSNCIYSGAFDIGVTLNGTTKEIFAKMRDAYSKAPPRLGFRLEPVSGLGQDAYFFLEKDGVRLQVLVGQNELSIGSGRSQGCQERCPPRRRRKSSRSRWRSRRCRR